MEKIGYSSKTFESKLVKNVHVIGDASNAAPMPKSAFICKYSRKSCSSSNSKNAKNNKSL